MLKGSNSVGFLLFLFFFFLKLKKKKKGGGDKPQKWPEVTRNHFNKKNDKGTFKIWAKFKG
jgi:hypothetical protein